MWWSLSLEFNNQKLSCKEEKVRKPTAVLWGSSMAPFMRLSMMLPSLASHAHIVQQHIFNVFEWPFKSSYGSAWFNWPHGKNLLNFKHSLLEHSVCCVLIKPVIWGPCWRLYVFQELHFREIYMWTGEVTPWLRIHAASVEHPCFCSQHPHCTHSLQNSSYKGSYTFSWPPSVPALYSRGTFIHIK